MQETIPQERIEASSLELNEQEAKFLIECIDVMTRQGGLQVATQAAQVAGKISQYAQSKANKNGQ